MGLNFCAILAFDDKIVKLFFSLFLVVGFYIVTVVPGLVASGMSGFHIMHESMQTPTPTPGQGGDLTKASFKYLLIPHTLGTPSAYKSPQMLPPPGAFLLDPVGLG